MNAASQKTTAIRNTSAEVTAGFKFSLLGAFSIVDPRDQFLPISSKKNRALLAILALSPSQTMTRERLVSLLWGDRGEEQARNSLRQSLAVLRKELGSEGSNLIRSLDEALTLQAGAVTVDALQVVAASTSNELLTLRAAAAQCHGELLADFGIQEESFAEWLAIERSHLESAMLRLFQKLTEQEAGPARIASAQRLVVLDPLREASQRALMQAYADAGENGLALKQFEKCQRLLRDQLGIAPAKETLDLSQRLANVEQPQAITGIAVPPKGSIAVLPFLNLSGDAEQEHFTDGLTEDIITDLSNAPGFFVIARNSTFAYKGKPTNVRQIARDLGVKYVLEGSARRSDTRLRINVQLVDAAEGGNHIWAERFDRDLKDIFEVQDEVTRRVVEAITGKLGTSQLVERYRPTNLEAYDLVVRSRNLFAQSRNAYEEARSRLERSIVLDPNYAEAHWRLAFVQAYSWGWSVEEHPADLASARESARRAVELDPNDSSAHATLGYVLINQRNWDDAQNSYETCLRLNPNAADSIAEFAHYKLAVGEARECTEFLARALRLNPKPPSWYFWVLGNAQIRLGQYADAVKTLRQEETYRTGSRRSLAAALALLGRDKEARDEAGYFMADNPHFRIAHWEATTPFKYQRDAKFWIDAFHLAGLPK